MLYNHFSSIWVILAPVCLLWKKSRAKIMFNQPLDKICDKSDTLFVLLRKWQRSQPACTFPRLPISVGCSSCQYTMIMIENKSNIGRLHFWSPSKWHDSKSLIAQVLVWWINEIAVIQSHKLIVEDPVTVEYITRYIAGLQQKYTLSGTVRPFGLLTLILDFDPYTSFPSLYQTDPSVTYSKIERQNGNRW